MDYFYLISSVFCVASASILATFYNRANESKRDISPLYSFVNICSVFIGWLIIFSFDFSFEPTVLLYSLGFGISYTLSVIGNVYALKNGPVALTALFIKLSLIVTTVWGFIFWGDKFTLLSAIGVVLVVISLWLCLYNGKSDKKISKKWILFVLISLFGGSGCTIIQRSQQMAFNGKHGSQLMVVATAISIVISLLLYLKSDKSDSKIILKKSWYLPVIAGALNLLLNIFVMLLATSSISPSLIYPLLAVGGLAIVSLVSVLVFNEKLRWWQWVGIGIGAIATAILSI